MKTNVIIDLDIKDLAIKYLENRKKELVLLQEAAEKCDWTYLSATAHKTKGVAATYGFQELTRLGQLLEADSLRNDQESVKRTIAAMHEYVYSVEIHFEEAA